MTTIAKNRARGAAFEAARKMHECGLMAMALPQLFTFHDFGKDQSNRNISVERGITNGWFEHRPEGLIALTALALEYFGDKPGPSKPAYKGEMATPRMALTSVFERAPLSKKYIPNRLGPRDDVPAFSVRAHMSFATLAG